ncbi:MAG TPA: S8 family serine peptidase, partial [Thermoanaerobaculia bacterium]|nr:S8 family serine peptidase [Thermoanaerobaculia bacterium]
PSSEGGDTTVPSIWTTDIMGVRGDNHGGPRAQGDAAGNYTSQFGGTSACAPGAGGTAALILSRSPNLTWQEVRDVFRRSSDKIDEANGQYDSNGHSVYYGYGRVNARKAVEAVLGKLPISSADRRSAPVGGRAARATPTPE